MAKAAIVSLDFDTGEMLNTIYSTEDGFDNPSQSAFNALHRYRPDFPNMHFAIIEDADAKQIRVDCTLRHLGIED